MIRQYEIRAQAGASEIKLFRGLKHTVVPLIALVEGVLQGVNAPAPEFISESAMSKTVAGWNGRPVVIDHPKVNGELVSANIPEVLDTELVGFLFNARVEEGKLKMEAWIEHDREGDPERIEKTLDRVLDGDVVELSTGFFADIQSAPGEFKGEAFDALITNIVPDHLAILSSSKGACSIADGAGTNRVNVAREVPEDELKSRKLEVTPAEQTLLQKAAELLGIKANRTHDDVMMALQGKLGQEFTDRWFYIFAVTDSEVIFMTYEGLFQRTYTIAGNGSVTLGEDLVEVRPETDFVPLNGNKKETLIMPNENTTALVEQLIANTQTQFTEEDREGLMGLDESMLSRMTPNEPVAPEAPAEPETTVVEVVANAAPVVQTFEEVLNSAPADVQESIAHGRRLYAERRDNLIAGIKANAKNKFTDEVLKAFDMDTIENLADLAQVDSFVGNGAPRAHSNEDPNAAPAPLLVFEPKKEA